MTALVFGGNFLLHRSFLSVQAVHVQGAVHETPGDVVLAAGLDTHPALIDISPDGIAASLVRLRWVDRAVVQRNWPDGVTIQIYERKPTSVAPDAHGVVQLVDRTGRRLGPAPVGTNLPRLSVVGPLTPWPYERWAAPAARVAAELPVAFAAQVYGVAMDAKRQISLVMTYPVTFILGDETRLHAKFVDVASIVAHQALHRGDVVDVSVPNSVVIQGK